MSRLADGQPILAMGERPIEAAPAPEANRGELDGAVLIVLGARLPLRGWTFRTGETPSAHVLASARQWRASATGSIASTRTIPGG
jgi:hypothetical protein